LAVAGFVSSAECWIEWEKEWLSRLREDGLDYFHRAELNKWNPVKREKLIEDLCRIIRTYVNSKTGVAVVNAKLRTKLSVDERTRWRLKAYALAGRTAAKEMRIWASQWQGPMPELIYEQGDYGTGDLMHLLTSQGYPAPIFKPKRTRKHQKSGLTIEGAIPLQAADLLAYEVFSRVRCVQENGYITKERHRLPDDLEKIPGECGFVTDDHLDFLKQGMEDLDKLVMIPKVRIKT
jgi:hypothetical protein